MDIVLDNIFSVYVEGAKKQFSQEEIYSANQAAHHLFYNLGSNVIPANPKVKGTGASIAILKSWNMYQNVSIPIEVFAMWQELGLFAYGIAIVLGKVWRGGNEGYHLNMIDADNELAIREICTYEGKTISLQDFATWTLIEQHKDNLNKAHFYVLSKVPFPVKASDIGKEVLGNKIKCNEIPGIEVKSIGGLSFCTNSMHVGGSRYEFLNRINPVHNDKFFLHIDEICKKYSLEYLGEDGKGIGDIPIEQLFNKETVIYEGNNRHKQLLRVIDSLIARLKDTIPIESIERYAWLENKRMCRPPLDIKEFEKLWKQALGFIAQKTSEDKALEDEIDSLYQSQNPSEKQNSEEVNDSELGPELGPESEPQPEEEQQLTPEEIRIAELCSRKLTDDDIEFILVTMTKEAEYDRLSVEQLFYGCSSAFTRKIIHHIVNSKESGSGKNYILSLVSGYFPRRFVTLLSGMSAKALFHKKGIMVIQNEDTGELVELEKYVKPIADELKEIRDKLSAEQYKDPKQRDKKLVKKLKQMAETREDRIKELEDKAQKLIDLENTILNCQDTPPPEVYYALMSVLSQDGGDRDLEYSFVDKDGSGRIGTTENIMKGTPCLNTCQTIDDTNNLRHAEKNRRFVNVNPETTPNKINAAKKIASEYDKLVVSREDKRRAKELVETIVVKLMQHSKKLGAREYGTKIPYILSIADALPDNRVWAMTIMERLIKYLSVIVKVHADTRPKILDVETKQVYPIATLVDLGKVFELMKVAAMGVRPYVVVWYNKVFLAAYKDLQKKPQADTDLEGNTLHIENYGGVTTIELSAKTSEVLGLKLGTKEIRDKYLYPLVNQGIVDMADSELDYRSYIFYPVDDGNVFSVLDDSDSKIRLKVKDSRIFPTKTFLKEQFGTIQNKNADDPHENKKNISIEPTYKILDIDDSEISLEILIDKYFNNPEDYFKISDNDNNGGTSDDQ